MELIALFFTVFFFLVSVDAAFEMFRITDSIHVCRDLAGPVKPPEQLVLGVMQSEPSHGHPSRSGPEIKIVCAVAFLTEIKVMASALCEGNVLHTL